MTRSIIRRAIARQLAVVVVGASISSVAQASDSVVTVNRAMLNTIRASAATTPPPRASRAMAMVGISMFDSVNAASGMSYASYSYAGGAVSGMSRDAVALSSGYTMMANLFPTLATSLNSDLAMHLGNLNIHSSQRAASLAFGQTVANNLFSARIGDGSATAQ